MLSQSSCHFLIAYRPRMWRPFQATLKLSSSLPGDRHVFYRCDRLFLKRVHAVLAEAFVGKALCRGIDISGEFVQQVLGREPGCHWGRVVGFPPDIAIPDAGFCQLLTHIGPAVCGKDEWHAKRARTHGSDHSQGCAADRVRECSPPQASGDQQGYLPIQLLTQQQEK